MTVNIDALKQRMMLANAVTDAEEVLATAEEAHDEVAMWKARVDLAKATIDLEKNTIENAKLQLKALGATA